MARHFGSYPTDWPDIAQRIKDAHGNRCERCGHPDEPPYKVGGDYGTFRIREWAKRHNLDPDAVKYGPAACDERCSHPPDGKQRMLTVHHLDLNKSNCEDWNLAALCQACHLVIQGRVTFDQDYMLDHSEWIRPHVEGRDAAMREGRWPVEAHA